MMQEVGLTGEHDNWPLPRSMPKAMLIDLDDTLLDTTLSATRTWKLAASAFEDEIGQPASVFEPILHESREWYWSDPDRNRAGRLDVQQSRIDVTLHGLQRLELNLSEEALNDLARRFSDHYTFSRVDSMRAFDGALETVAKFREMGMKLALITNGDAQHQRDKVARFNLEAMFDAILIEGELGYGKPMPRIFERALELCGARPDQAWCVGDNLEWEVRAPQAMGLRGIWHDWEGVGLPATSKVKPDAVIQQVSEMLGWF